MLYLAGYKSGELVSLEEYFGQDTQGYYRAIADSLGQAYTPEERDVSPWMDYYLRAHAEQARAAVAEHQLVRAQTDSLVAAFAGSLSGSVRPVIGLWAACRLGEITNSMYRELLDVGNQTAARHLARLVGAGLLTRQGKGRGIHYVPTDAVLRVYEAAGAGE